ncbi:CTLH/CRA C-terminal to LisH motif domain [Phytophthora cactorum]|nr:CTLH/CRA C-terminal to LisH motif domain [Phytophthora cactorum]
MELSYPLRARALRGRQQELPSVPQAADTRTGAGCSADRGAGRRRRAAARPPHGRRGGHQEARGAGGEAPGLEEKRQEQCLEQQNDLQSCATRTRYLETLEEAKVGGDPSLSGLQTGSINDRLIADFLLGQGYLESAKSSKTLKMSATWWITSFMRNAKRAEGSASSHTDKAITWCSQNGSRLRRLQSQLEFHLRLQDFIEFIAMATLAFESPEKCGIEAYEKIFALDRWMILEKMFRKTFNDVYGMHDPPSLCIALARRTVYAELAGVSSRTRCQFEGETCTQWSTRQATTSRRGRRR